MGKVLVPGFFQEKGFPCPSPAFHYELDALIRSNTDERVVCIAPRDSAKSTIMAGLGVIWHIFFEDLYNFVTGVTKEYRQLPKFVVIQSKTQGEAVRRLGTIKDILQGIEGARPFARIIGRWNEKSAISWQKTFIKFKYKGQPVTILALGTGQQVRGLKEGFIRVTLAVLDDPEDEKNTKTEDSLEHNLNDLLQGLEPAVRGKLWVIGTPQHPRGMVNVLMKTPGWTGRLYRNNLDKGELIWKERISKEYLTAKKEAYKQIHRLHIYLREYECRLTSPETQIVNEEDFRFYEGDVEWLGDRPFLHVTHRERDFDGKPIALEEKEIIPINIFLGVDPASSTSKRAAYTCVVPVGVDKNLNEYVLPYYRGRLDPYDVARKILSMYKVWNPLWVVIETTGYQEMLASYLRKSGEVDVYLPIRTEKPRKKKVGEGSRLDGLQPKLKARKVHVKANMTHFLEEWCMHPDSEFHDLKDAYYYAQRFTYRANHTVEDVQETKVVRGQRNPMAA